MNKTLRDGVQDLSVDVLNNIRNSLVGSAPMTDKIKESVRMVSLGIKLEHMGQIEEQSNRSFALRLIPHLPKTIDKDEYVRLTNPQIAPLMLPAPKKELKGKKQEK